MKPPRREDMAKAEAAPLLAQILRVALPGLKADLAKAFAESVWKLARDRRDEDDRRQEQRRRDRGADAREQDYWSSREPGEAAQQPWQVLGVSFGATEAEVRRAWRRLVVDAHPDRGGSHQRTAEINAARDAMLEAARARA